MPLFHHAQQIDLHRNILALEIPAEPFHVLFVDLIRTSIMNQIRMCHIDILSGFHSGDAEIHILFQILFRLGREPGIRSGHFAGSKMFSQNHIIHRIAVQQLILFLHQFRNILRFKANVNGNIPGILLPQCLQRIKVAVQFLWFHPGVRNIILRENPGAVIGKAQYLHALLNGIFHIFLVLTPGVPAASRVGVIIR